MEKNEFCFYFSQKSCQEAAREIALRIKSRFPFALNFLLILFTPGYCPETLLKALKLVLKNPNIFGAETPFLIYKNEIIERGVLACCINKKGVGFDNFFIGSRTPEEIEQKLKSDFKKIKKTDIHLISFLSPQINPIDFLEGLRFSFGKLDDFSGAGYKNKTNPQKHFVFANGIGNGIVNLNLTGLRTKQTYFHNFTPLGKPFKITKFNFRQQIIHEINNKPAVEIYKYYLGKKFNTFVQNRLFSYYPLGIPGNDSFRLLAITGTLEDGSLRFKGNLRHKSEAHLMILKEKNPRQGLGKKLKKIKTPEKGIVFIINSLDRKRNLGNASENEVKKIAEILSPEKEVFGLFSDYCFFPDPQTQKINMESGGILLNVWE